MSQDITGGRQSGSAASGRANGDQSSSTITQELVNQIADKVYAMLLSDLRIKEERGRFSPRKPFAERGGW